MANGTPPDALRIVIVGGGSAGWLVAGYLAMLGRMSAPGPISITLVESDAIPRIGVGEATVPSIRSTLSLLGISESEFIRATHATWKQAIAFEGWRDGSDKFYHPFDRRQVAAPDRVVRDWLESDRRCRWDLHVSPQAALCDLGLSPKPRGGAPDYFAPVPYAYHTDADAFGDLLKTKFAGRHVDHVIGTVAGYKQSDSGFVTSISLTDGRQIAGDLFVDCTGSRALLIGDAMGVRYTSYARHLLCDRALAFRVPVDSKNHSPRPYTRSISMSAGWRWDIPLQTRVGTGYVYSSAHMTDEAAESEMRAVLGEMSNNIEPRRLRFKVGRREVFWHRNVVAMGMSSGFIEPLESTAIYLVEASAGLLATMLPTSRSADGFGLLARTFNQSMSWLYDEVLDFVNLHYVLSLRRDTDFWRDATTSNRRTERIAELLELWAHKPPSNFDFPYPLRLFSAQSYEHILFGLSSHIACGHVSGTQPAAPVPGIGAAIRHAQSSLMSVAESLGAPRHKVGAFGHA